ncbi:MAG: glycosyltransferase [Vicinamibacterales bacterium]
MSTLPAAAPGLATLSVAVEGPVDTSFSLAIVNRAFTDALARQPGVTAAIGVPTRGTTHAIRNMYPPRLDRGVAGVRTYFYLAWEDSRIPMAWAQAINRGFDGLLVPSTHVRDAVRRSGVAIPVAVVPYGVEPPPGRRPPSAVVPTRASFRFLHVSTGFPRKGCDVLVRAFAREFSASEDVALVVKTLPQYDHPTRWLVRRTRWLTRRCPEIVHVDRDLDAPALADLYASASCLVHPARAEGFGLPIAEAMHAGVPVIVSDGSGHADFCTADTALLVRSTPAPSRSPFVVQDAEWREPDEAALRAAMRSMYERRDEAATRARVARAAAHIRGFTWDRAAERAVRAVQAIDAGRHLPVRGAMLTTWRERCGIAEYSRQLIDATADPALSWTILAPHRTPDGTGAGRAPDGDPPVIRCWADRWPTALDGAVARIRERDLRFVHVQTHLITWGTDAARALASLVDEGRRVFVTLHSVRDARPAPEVVEAFRRLDRVIVHTEQDRLRLRRLGLADNVLVLPQGYPAPPAAGDPEARLRPLPGRPVIGTSGFLRPHKGVLELIRAVARLRMRYPGIGLHAVTALYPSDDSRAYLARCQAEARRLGLADHCRFVTDFLEPADMLAALQDCDIVVLPYARTIDSSSAAVRIALASRRPVVTTAVPVFAEVRDAVHTASGRSPGALAEAIDRLLEDRGLQDELAARARRHLERDSWTVVGETYRKLVRGAMMDLGPLARAYPFDTP